MIRIYVTLTLRLVKFMKMKSNAEKSKTCSIIFLKQEFT